MIELEQVSFGYGENQETLSQVSATIARGECVLLCGASGNFKRVSRQIGVVDALGRNLGKCRLESRKQF